MEIQYRKLLPFESNSYRELRLECLKKFPQFFTTNYKDEKLNKKVFFQTFIEQSDPENFVIGAFHNNNLIGISGFKRHERKKINHGGIIIQVYVKPEYQGRTIGTKTIKYTLNEAFKLNGLEQIEIGVISSNANAEKIYKDIGFKVFGLQKNFMKVDNFYYDHKMMTISKNQYKLMSPYTNN